jgi:hypothetical protein
MKTCSTCKISQPLSNFQKCVTRKDGHQYRCRECQNALTRAAWHKNGDKNRARNRAYKRTEAGLDSSSRWSKSNREKRNAQKMVQVAVLSGKLVRKPCVKCGDKAEGHHEDYSKPLDVVWLCQAHHAERHRELREMVAASRKGTPRIHTRGFSSAIGELGPKNPSSFLQ